jgi:hypothetical protein
MRVATMTQYRMRGTALYNKHNHRIAVMRDKSIFDADNRRIGGVRGNELFDSDVSLMMRVSGRDILDARNTEVATLSEAKEEQLR